MYEIAIIGFGVVGSGTVELLYKNKQNIQTKLDETLDIKYILDICDFKDSPYANKMIKDINIILNDPDIRVVVESIGGLVPAFDHVSACLKKGKTVVTSNKELIACKGAELLVLASENNCNLFFEASVGGAIPIIRPIHQCLVANKITQVDAVLNGTTNFILTKMLAEEMSFFDALNMAQTLRYAEKDPSADVDGHDACRKICILASLIFGEHVYPKYVYTEGISAITKEDALYAENWGGVIKLIASVQLMDNGKILPMVRPAFVSNLNQLSHIDDVFNGIMVCGDAIDKVMFFGRGAGKFPTASAVVADIIDAVKSLGSKNTLTWVDSGKTNFIYDYTQAEVSMYIRMIFVNRDETLSLIKHCFGEVQYLMRKGRDKDELAFVTLPDIECNISKKIAELSAYDITVISSIRILDR